MRRFAKHARLTINNAQFFGYHGVRKEERSLGGRYAVDADIQYDASKAVVSDDISDAVNYEEILYHIREHMNPEEPYDLIETMAFDIAVAIIEQLSMVNEVTIRVRKLSVPIQQVLDDVETEITVIRGE